MRWPALFTLFGVILCAACAPMVGASTPQAPVAAALGEAFTLAAGETARVGPERTGITFDAVVSDSRCPTDVQCIRAGEAIVHASVAVPGQAAETVELQTNSNRDQASVAGYTLTLIRVLPEPNTTKPTNAADYRATFTLTRS